MSTRFFIYLIVLTIVAITGMVKYKKLTTPFRLLVALILITIISEVSSRFFAYRIRNSSPPYHFYAPIQLLLYAAIYFRLLKNARTKTFILYGTPVLVIFSMLNSIFLQDLYTFPSNSIITISFMLIVLSLLYFREMLQYPLQISLVRQSTFWFNCAVLVFFCTTFFIYCFYNYFLIYHIKTKLISTINYIMTIAYYSVLTFAMLTDNKSNGSKQ